MAESSILGIDVAKESFVVSLLVGQRKLGGSFPNSPEGFKGLGRWLSKHKAGACHACLEATGRYWEDLAYSLVAMGHKVSVVNPARIASYAKSQLSRNKSDSLDADLIARFCQKENPSAWVAPSAEQRQLQDMTRHLEELIATRTQERNRLGSCADSSPVRPFIQAHLAFIAQQIATLERQIREHIDSHPKLKADRDLLTSIPGIGEASAAKLLGESLASLASARAAGAHSGLSPHTRQSGTSLHARGTISRTGNTRLRACLYYPALSAKRCNPTIARFAKRLEAKGKPKMLIVAACMRKLLCLAWSVLNSRVPYDPLFAQHRHSLPCP